MKANRFSSLLAGVSLAAALILSCSTLKDISEGNGLLGGSNLLQNNKLQNGFMSGTTDVFEGADIIESVEIGGTALSGGSTLITITSREELQELYLQLEGDPNIYVWTLDPEDDITPPGASNFVYLISLEFSQELGEDEDGQEVPARTLTVGGKTKAGQTVEKVEEEMEVKQVGSGALQISLSWDVDADLDLNVFTPSGTRLYWNNKTPAPAEGYGKGELDVDSNGGRLAGGVCVIDGIRSENVFFEAPLEDGDYTVIVRLYGKCNAEQGARYNVTANLGSFVQFSDKQSGQFDDNAQGRQSLITASYVEDESTKVIGVIKVLNGQIVR